MQSSPKSAFFNGQVRLYNVCLMGHKSSRIHFELEWPAHIPQHVKIPCLPLSLANRHNHATFNHYLEPSQSSIFERLRRKSASRFNCLSPRKTKHLEDGGKGEM